MVMDVRPGRDEALSRLFEAHYADTVRLGFYLTGSWAASSPTECGRSAREATIARRVRSASAPQPSASP